MHFSKQPQHIHRLTVTVVEVFSGYTGEEAFWEVPAKVEVERVVKVQVDYLLNPGVIHERSYSRNFTRDRLSQILRSFFLFWILCLWNC